MLWIFIPLIFLAAAVTFYATRHYASQAQEELLKECADEIQKETEGGDKKNTTKRLSRLPVNTGSCYTPA